MPYGLRSIGAEPPTTEPFPREPILGAEVDTLVQDHAVVDVLDVERVDLPLETGREVSCRRGVAHNVVRKQRLIVQQRGGGRRLDRVLLLGAIIVNLEREAFRKRRLKHRAVEFIGGGLRLQIRIGAIHDRHQIGLIAPRWIGQGGRRARRHAAIFGEARRTVTFGVAAADQQPPERRPRRAILRHAVAFRIAAALVATSKISLEPIQERQSVRFAHEGDLQLAKRRSADALVPIARRRGHHRKAGKRHGRVLAVLFFVGRAERRTNRPAPDCVHVAVGRKIDTVEQRASVHRRIECRLLQQRALIHGAHDPLVDEGIEALGRVVVIREGIERRRVERAGNRMIFLILPAVARIPAPRLAELAAHAGGDAVRLGFRLLRELTPLREHHPELDRFAERIVGRRDRDIGDIDRQRLRETARVAESVGAIGFDVFGHFVGARGRQTAALRGSDELQIRGGIGDALALGHNRRAGLAGVIGRAALKRRNRRSRGGPSRRQQHPHTGNGNESRGRRRLHRRGVAPLDALVGAQRRRTGGGVVALDGGAEIRVFGERALRGKERVAVVIVKRQRAPESAAQTRDAGRDRRLPLPRAAVRSHLNGAVDLGTDPRFFQHDIDHARDRIRAVESRSTVGDDFHAFDEPERDRVQVDEALARVGTAVAFTRLSDAPTIDEHQGRAGTETAQTHAGRAGLHGGIGAEHRADPGARRKGNQVLGALSGGDIEVIRSGVAARADAVVGLRHGAHEIGEVHRARRPDVVDVVGGNR